MILLKPKLKKPKGVTIYTFKDKKGEIVAATFDFRASQALSAFFGNADLHEAKSATTKGMYGKLFGLSGVARSGALALNKKMSKAQKSARGENAAKARWN
jgi:hypothetical protein